MDLHQILINSILTVGVFMMIAILVNLVQTIIYAERREKREREQVAKDDEYHRLRMANLKK